LYKITQFMRLKLMKHKILFTKLRCQKLEIFLENLWTTVFRLFNLFPMTNSSWK
jgi:hypothetical protein